MQESSTGGTSTWPFAAWLLPPPPPLLLLLLLRLLLRLLLLRLYVVYERAAGTVADAARTPAAA
eukprot:COSAG02_NODE_1147_length_14223_cov_4.760337_4_plen_64_part_00